MDDSTPQPQSTHYDASYLLDVLDISDGDTEEQYDRRLRSEAEELGIMCGLRENITDVQCRPPSTVTASFEMSRRSNSVSSRASASTGLTSNFSVASISPSLTTASSQFPRASLSFRNYDTFLPRASRSRRQQSPSFSPRSKSPHAARSLESTRSLQPEWLHKRNFRRVRGLSMLRLNRRDSVSLLGAVCPYCPRDDSCERRATHKLPCGHGLCTQAIRSIIKSAMNSRTEVVPSCCSISIPGSLVELVMTKEEQSALLEKLEEWDEAVCLAPRASLSSQRSSLLADDSRDSTVTPGPQMLSQRARKGIDGDTQRSEYLSLKATQNRQRGCFLAWVSRQRLALEHEQEGPREAMRSHQQSALEDLFERHASAMCEAEDKQVKAEADMREAQEKERRDHHTALKHMEAYCAGTYSTGDLHHRDVTGQDRAELDKARRARHTMYAKHESAINILRGEQSRRIRMRGQRQENEVKDLQRQQRKEELEMERTFTSELKQLNEDAAEKFCKLQWRWEVQMAILVKQIESKSGMCSRSKLPSAEEGQSGGDQSQVRFESTARLMADARIGALSTAWQMKYHG